jgi:hypothetical protein
MLKIMIPRFKYWKSAPAGETSYPNLQDDAEGQAIPEAYGVLKNVTPICIDTTTLKYKFSRRGLHAIDQIRNNGVALVEWADYAPDPPNGEFSIISAPYLAANTTYYFVIERTGAVDPDNHIGIKMPSSPICPDGNAFTINAAGVWTSEPSLDLHFRLRGKLTIDGPEVIMINTVTWQWNGSIGLKDDVARTRLAQSFKTGASGYYVTSIRLWTVNHGSPAPTNIRITILSTAPVPGSDPPLPAEVRVGAYSFWCANETDNIWQSPLITFPAKPEISNLVGDIQGIENPDTSLMENISDVLKDIYVNIIGGTAAGINAADLVTLHDARLNQDVALYMADELEAQQYIEILEAGHLFKFLPSLGGDFAVRCLTSGEPSGTPHLKAEHIRNFTMRRVWSNVFHVAKIKYYQDPTTGDWLVAEAKSDIAPYLYNRQESIEIETALKDAADTVQLAKDYLGTVSTPPSVRKVNLQYPTRIAEFDVLAGYGFDLIPTMKVKLTLPRADYGGGALNGILFRILEVHKNPEDRSSHLVTLLDSLTY